MTEKAGPLSGLRVIEMGTLIAGPFCGQVLGDFGAEVIKIEDPKKGDPMRQWGRSLPQGHSPWWPVIGRNKKSVTLDLRGPEGQAIARKLLEKADVLVENFRPGTLEKWGLGYEDLVKINPGIIISRASGYGQTGPMSQKAGYALVGEAMGGLRYVNGEPDRPPARAGISIGDSLSGLHGALGVMMALHHRQATGRGQVVDVSIYESVLAVMENTITEFALTGYQRERSGAILPGIAPSNAYPCSDGDIVIGANQDKVFARFAETIGKPGWAEDPRFKTHHARGERQTELDGLISDWTRNRTVAEVDRIMSEAGVPAGPIYRPDQMLSDPQFVARDAIHWEEHPKLGRIPMQNVFPKLSETPGAIRRPAPDVVGQHSDEILGAMLGFGAEELAQLRRDGVI
ncbi:MAG: CoA transferase [Caulobacter sp.]